MSIKITIFGYGFVGRAHENVLGSLHDITIVDPALDLTDPGNPDAVIIAVSTPQSKTGECYMQNVYDVLKKCKKDTPILIKSTISLEGWQYIKKEFGHLTITFSPEFLRAATALQDFENADTFYFGGGDDVFWAGLFWQEGRRMFSRKPEELIMMKYSVNTFLALKVAYFNQINDLCDAWDIDYDNVKTLIQHDKRIGDSHMDISEERGFGGHCFPKDTEAFLATSDVSKSNMSILEAAVEYNRMTRDWSND